MVEGTALEKRQARKGLESSNLSLSAKLSMKKKIVVGILYGGKSVEHEVSCRSAENIIRALNRKKYRPVRLFIDKQGRFGTAPNTWPVLQRRVDVIFPILHGSNGEDGTVQGLLKLADIPFVGAGVLASAIGMDKEITKLLWQKAGLPVGDFFVLRPTQTISYDSIRKTLGPVVFVKPANAGSSVGVSKVKRASDWRPALKKAFRYDTKVIVESFIPGREIEVSVLGNEQPRASVPGEVIPRHEFYSYEAKYLDENGADLLIPARLTARQTRQCQRLAVQAFQTIGCEGLARVDFFIRRKDGKIFLNEINTLPGFTSISMYPKLWSASGLKQSRLLDTLIQLALKRHTRNQRLATHFTLPKSTGR